MTDTGGWISLQCGSALGRGDAMIGSSSRKSPFQWRRGPRSSFSLEKETGVYALFLRSGSTLNGVQPGQGGLIYIGMAGGKDGLYGRCHFKGRTCNHSPRKSFAVVLLEELALAPILVPKKRQPDTWGLDKESDARLSAWMHANLDLAIEACSDPVEREIDLIWSHAPPLNLDKCIQTPQHRMVSRARDEVLARVRAAFGSKEIVTSVRHYSPPSASCRFKEET